MGAAITALAAAVPDRRLDNDELAGRLGVSEDWIFERTGIRTRRIASDDETSSSLATVAAQRALAAAGVTPDEIDMVIVATVTPDYQFPATASLVQAALGATRAGAFDLGAGCSGFLFALAQAAALVESASARRVLICGSDVLSRVTDYDDPRSCVLFGDGAGAALIEDVNGASAIGPFNLRSDGSRPELLCVPAGAPFMQMHGREVYRHAVEGMTHAVQDVLGSAKVSIDDVGLLIAHQANARILDAVASRLRWPGARVVTNIERYGNTSSASIPIALSEALNDGMVRDGDLMVLTAFGAGFAWGAGLVRWTAPVPQARTLVGVGDTHA